MEYLRQHQSRQPTIYRDENCAWDEWRREDGNLRGSRLQSLRMRRMPNLRCWLRMRLLLSLFVPKSRFICGPAAEIPRFDEVAVRRRKVSNGIDKGGANTGQYLIPDIPHSTLVYYNPKPHPRLTSAFDQHIAPPSCPWSPPPSHPWWCSYASSPSSWPFYPPRRWQ